MSAEILRRAAALMRERAEAARAGRWLADGSEVYADWQDNPRYIGICDGSLPEGNVANAEHIASWHPAVALAVADWLDVIAGPLGLIESGDYWNSNSGWNASVHAALAVARAYLGESA